MKTFFQQTWLIALACILFCGCENPDFTEDAGAQGVIGNGVNVQFCITHFDQAPFNTDNDVTRSTNINDLCSRIQMAIFSNDSRVATVNQTKGDNSFGTLSANLPEGTYQVVIIAHNGAGNATMTNPEKITFKDNKVTDTFYYYEEIEVSESKQYDVKMKRAVAMFRMQTEDNIPENVAQMKFYYTGGSSTFDAVSGYGCVNSKQTEYRTVTASMTGQPGMFEIYTFPHAEEDELKITVSALGTGDNILQERIFENVPVELNTITNWKGSFYGSSSDSGEITFVLTTDDEWEQIDYSY